VRGTPQMRSTMKQIFAEFAGRQFARAHILRALSAALIGLVARTMARGSMPDSAMQAGLFQRFEALLEQHFLAHWTVSQYAAALSITPAHLGRITRSATGHPTSHLIAERIVREARRNLVYTNLPVSTIAYSLGFNDPAYFSRLFSTATGVSPRDFRARVHG
jgi:AraC family transcriptional activator of pobA